MNIPIKNNRRERKQKNLNGQADQEMKKAPVFRGS
jgi:hypothetical protein